MMKKILLLFCLVFGLSFVPTAQAAMISEKQEIEMGERAGKALEAQYGLYQDDEVASRIDRIGKALAAHSTRQIPYTFKVLNTQDVNALACPGGFIYVYKGLVDTMTSDDELAAVLGHEIGHIEKRHTVHQIEKQMALSLLTILAGAASGDPGAGLALASTVSSALMASYSRGDEREADQEGFRLVKEAGFNPYGAAVTMAKLEDLAKDYGNPEYGLHSSHPEPEARLKAALKEVDALHLPEKVTENADGSATVSDGAFSYTFSKANGYDKPLYRARLMAGALYLVEKRGPVDGTHFISIDSDRSSDIYYEDIRILRFYDSDRALGESLSDGAMRITEQLQKWAAAAADRQKAQKAVSIHPPLKKAA